MFLKYTGNCCSSSHALTCILHNLKRHYHVQRSFPFRPIRGQRSAVHIRVFKMAPISVNHADERIISPSYRGNNEIKSTKVCEDHHLSSHLDYTSEELQKLHEDRYELQQILHVAIRGSMKDIIQSETNLITAKTGSLHDLSSGLSYEGATWAEVVARKIKSPTTIPCLSPC